MIINTPPLIKDTWAAMKIRLMTDKALFEAVNAAGTPYKPAIDVNLAVIDSLLLRVKEVEANSELLN